METINLEEFISILNKKLVEISGTNFDFVGEYITFYNSNDNKFEFHQISNNNVDIMTFTLKFILYLNSIKNDQVFKIYFEFNKLIIEYKEYKIKIIKKIEDEVFYAYENFLNDLKK